MNNNAMMATIVTQTKPQEPAEILTNEAPTIVEKYDNPLYITADGDYRPIESQFISVNAKSLPSILALRAGDKFKMRAIVKVVRKNYYESESGEKSSLYNLKIVAANL